VGSLVSAGQVSGADAYNGTDLVIPYVQVGAPGTVYADVVIRIGRVVRVEGGMPKSARDSYDPATGQLTIGAVQAGGNFYTNVVVTLGRIVHVGGINPQPTLGQGALSLRCLSWPYCEAKSVQLVNTGTTPLHISSIAITMNGLPDPLQGFGQSNDCPATVGPGQACAIFVRLYTDAVPYQSTLTVTDDGVGSPRTVALSTF
jgi:hypothetical protein